MCSFSCICNTSLVYIIYLEVRGKKCSIVVIIDSTETKIQLKEGVGRSKSSLYKAKTNC